MDFFHIHISISYPHMLHVCTGTPNNCVAGDALRVSTLFLSSCLERILKSCCTFRIFLIASTVEYQEHKLLEFRASWDLRHWNNKESVAVFSSFIQDLRILLITSNKMGILPNSERVPKLEVNFPIPKICLKILLWTFSISVLWTFCKLFWKCLRKCPQISAPYNRIGLTLSMPSFSGLKLAIMLN